MDDLDDIFGELDKPVVDTVPPAPVTTEVATTETTTAASGGTNDWKKKDSTDLYDLDTFKPKRIEKDKLNKPEKEFIMVVNEDIDKETEASIIAICKGLTEKGFKVRTTLNPTDCKINTIIKKIDDEDKITTYVPYKSFSKKLRVYHKEAKHPDADCYNVAAGLNSKFFDSNSKAARAYQARNVHTVLGDETINPAMFLICFSTDGAEDYKTATYKKTGNVNSYIRVASFAGIPIFNLGKAASKTRLVEYIKTIITK